jgi:hypothetical protein
MNVAPLVRLQAKLPNFVLYSDLSSPYSVLQVLHALDKAQKISCIKEDHAHRLDYQYPQAFIIIHFIYHIQRNLVVSISEQVAALLTQYVQQSRISEPTFHPYTTKQVIERTTICQTTARVKAAISFVAFRAFGVITYLVETDVAASAKSSFQTGQGSRLGDAVVW